MSTVAKSLEELAVDTIRTLAIDGVQKAESGHPGLPLGAAPMAYVLWQNFLKHNPTDPKWPDRDRFVLSAGHGSMLLYCLLHLTGYDLSLDDLKSFRQWGSKTPGHPEIHLTPGIEATTGPLGQGTTNAVGMAIAERVLAFRFNRPDNEIVNHRTYALVSDGDLMEGVSGEVSSLAGHLGLGKLTFLYDSNEVSLDGPTRVTFTEDVGKRYEAYGWHVLQVEDGNTDLAAIEAALKKAEIEINRPSLDHHQDDDRLRLAQQGGDVGGARQPAGERRGRPHQEAARLGVGGAVLRAAGGPGALPHRDRPRQGRPGGLGGALQDLDREVPRSRQGMAGRLGARPPRGLGQGPAGL